MTKEVRKTNLRMTPEQFAEVARRARQVGWSVNHYIVSAVSAYSTDRDQAEQIKALVDEKLSQQSEALVSVLSRLDAAHAEQDQALRDSLRRALDKVMRAVNDPDVQAAIRSADPLNKEPTK